MPAASPHWWVVNALGGFTITTSPDHMEVSVWQQQQDGQHVDRGDWWWVCTHSTHMDSHFCIFLHLCTLEVFSTIQTSSTPLHSQTPKCPAHMSTISKCFIMCPHITHQHISEYSTIIHTCITCCQNLRTFADTHLFISHHIPGTLYRISEHLPAWKHMYAEYPVLSMHGMQNIRNTFGNIWTPINLIIQHS